MNGLKQVKNDLKEYNLREDLEWIRSKSKESFKTLVKKKTEEIALEELKMAKEKHTNFAVCEQSIYKHCFS